MTFALIPLDLGMAEDQHLRQRVLELEAQLAGREAALQALRAEQQRAVTHFNAAPNAALVLDAQGVIQDVNALASSWLGLSAQRLQRRSFALFLAPPDRHAFQRLLRRADDCSQSHTAELKLLQRDGSLRHVTLSLRAVPPGQPVQDYLVTLVDFSSHHAAQLTLLDENEHLKQQVRTYRTALQVQGDEWDDIVQGLCREVQAATISTALLLDQLSTEDAILEASREIVRHKLDQAHQVTEAVLKYARLNHGRVCLKPVSLQQVYRQVQRELAPLLHQRQVKITSDPLPMVHGDIGTLKTIFRELLGNAVKFTGTREVAQICIRVQETAEHIQVRIEDNGIGFNMRRRETLFHPFRPLSADQLFGGIGMGLPTVRRVARRFGARVWAEGKVEQGATVWLSWPKVPTLLR